LFIECFEVNVGHEESLLLEVILKKGDFLIDIVFVFKAFVVVLDGL
jgi:hypothetical protein